MPIGLVKEKGSFFYVYDEKGKQLYTKSLGSGQVLGYTSGTVSIKKGAFIYMYDEKGKQVSAKGA